MAVIPMLILDRGDRRTIRVRWTHPEPPPAPALMFSHGGDWYQVDPDEPGNDGGMEYTDDGIVYYAVYSVQFAYGAESDFAESHPAGTKVITAPVELNARIPVGSSDVDRQPVAWIRTKG